MTDPEPPSESEKKLKKQRRRYYDNRLAKGVCTFCGRKAAPNYTICLWHLEKRRTIHGNKPWVPGGPGRPPVGIQRELDKMKRRAAKKLREDLVKLAATHKLGEEEAPAFMKAYRKRIRAARAKDPKADIVMEEMLRVPDYDEMISLLGAESAEEFDKNMMRVHGQLAEGDRHETMGDDSGVPKGDGDGGGGPSVGPDLGQDV